MPVVSALSPVSLSSYFDPNTGAVLQVNLYFYKAGTLDPLPTYADAQLSVLCPQPLPSTGYGRVPPVFIGEMPAPGYRVRVFNQYSELVEDLDNLPGAVAPDGGGGGEGPVQPDDVHLLKTGDYVFAGRNATPREGAVLANGLTIGSSASPATGRANDDAHDLFVLLWGADEYGLLPVLPSRGASAEGDWLANKAITLPDMQGRAVVGMDAMGAPATNRLAGVPTQTGSDLPARVFARGGAALSTLTAAMIPAHKHTLTDPGHLHNVPIPGHAHTFFNGVAAAAGAHTHTGTTDVQGVHTHVYYAGNDDQNYGGGPSSHSSPPGAKNTEPSGAHGHNVYLTTDGVHGHSVTGNITNYNGQNVNSGASATGLTMADTGGGEAHNNTPLFLTVSVYMVL